MNHSRITCINLAPLSDSIVSEGGARISSVYASSFGRITVKEVLPFPLSTSTFP